MTSTSRWHQSARLSGAGTALRIAEKWGRLAAVGVAVLVQLGLLAASVTWLADHSWVLYGGLWALSILVLLVVLSSDRAAEYKLAWTIPLLLAPLFGGAFYLFFGRSGYSRAERRHARALHRRSLEALRWVEPSPLPDDDRAAAQVHLLQRLGDAPAFTGTASTYYPLGELAFEQMLADIRRARRYVFVEYYIVAEGQMWARLFDALAEKAQAGLDVRVLYDDLGSLLTLPLGFRRRLEDAGIKVHAVGEVGPVFQLRMNNRDHRKILCVDGRTAWTGGINVADEYINAKVRFGHWKDCAIRLEGPGAWPFAVMFLEGWDLVAGVDEDLRLFLPNPPEQPRDVTGIVAPFDDNPFDDVRLGASVYRSLLRHARRSVDVFTPYLVIGDDLTHALTDLAASGVRVRVVTPGVPDKRLVYEVTRSAYARLVDNGVEVYEYTPGFLHSKAIVVDEEQAVVGSINFDFRSLYLQEECAVWMHGTAAVTQVAADVEATVALSRRITPEMCRVPWWRRLVRAVLGTFSPLM